MASIVIPSYNNWELTHSLLLDVYKNLPHDCEVVVTDDCSKDANVFSGLEWWKSSMFDGRMRIIVSNKNRGFLKNANIGVSRATHGVVLLISNDVKIRDNRLVQKVYEALDESPMTLVGARLLDYDTGWNTFNGKTFPYLEGWFLAFRKSEWPMFDEQFAPYDFEDVDISTEYISRGGKLKQIDVDMEHLGAQTYKYSPERELQTKINQEKFRQKWVAS